MRRRRIIGVAICILLVLFLLLVRLMQVQLFHTEHFAKNHINLLEESVKQRTQEILIDDGRGQFLDNEGQPLSFEESTVLVLFPFLAQIDWDRDELVRILQTSKAELERKIKQARTPFIFGTLDEVQAEKVKQLNIPGVYAVDKKVSRNDIPAGQLIGLTGENRLLLKERYPDKRLLHDVKIGITGLQKSFDPFLLPESEAKLVYHVDGLGGPLFGIDVKYTGQSNPYYPLKVKTTIDRQYQEELESLLDQHEVKEGGAVLLDIQSGGIVALASRPFINQKDPFSDEGTKNMMFEQHIPGSIFKTVVAAAVFEKGLASKNERFNCDLNIRGEEAERKLGFLSLEESFARSCNNTFGDLAYRLQETDDTSLIDYGHKLGLFGSVSWEGDVFQLESFRQFTHAKGRVYADKNNMKDRNYVAQTGIGQHEVRVSPINVANMMAVIARGGDHISVRAATEVQYGNGAAMYKFPEQHHHKDNISKYSAMKLQQLLRMVVTDQEGTGRAFAELPYEVAGKSGTAETGVEKEGQQLHHKWFAGYFPFKEPKYALVVVNLNVPHDQGAVNPLFADIVTMVFNKNNEKTTQYEP